MEWIDYLDFINNEFKFFEVKDKPYPCFAKFDIAECAGLFAIKDGAKYAANEGFTLYNKPYKFEIEIEGTEAKKTIEYNEFEAMKRFIEI